MDGPGDKVQFSRKPQGASLDADSIAALQRLIGERGVRSLMKSFGVSAPALARAAAGMRVLAGTRALISAGLATTVNEPER